jgi:hypothetical protein
MPSYVLRVLCREELKTDYDSVAPSYCCWQGVLCCHEHSIYSDAITNQPCDHYAVMMLQLRAANLTNHLHLILPELRVLHRYVSVRVLHMCGLLGLAWGAFCCTCAALRVLHRCRLL